MFQSLLVLEALSLKEHTPAYDYLDDIESFFYVLCYIFLVYLPDGRRLSSKDPGASLVWTWGERDTRQAFTNKRYIFGFGGDTIKAYEVVEKNWGPICYRLFESFLEWMAERREEKIELVLSTAGAGSSKDHLQRLHAHRNEHFNAVLKMFDEAIDAAQSTAPTSTEAPAITNQIPPVDVSFPVTASSSCEGPIATTPSILATAPTDDGPQSSKASSAKDAVRDPSSSSVPLSVTEVLVPTTPPRAVTPPKDLSSPSTPNRKRRSEGGEHPESPGSKSRRVAEGKLATTLPA